MILNAHVLPLRRLDAIGSSGCSRLHHSPKCDSEKPTDGHRAALERLLGDISRGRESLGAP